MKTLLVFLLIALPVLAQAQTPATPKIFFEYSWLFDSTCAQTHENGIQQSWVNEVTSREAEFSALWEKAEPIFFGKVYELFGSGFSRKEMTATLTLCKIFSFSSPLTLNVTRFLKSYMGTQPVATDEAFVDLVFHELLHTWVVEHTAWPTPMIQKYMSEDKTTRNHLHLMALQKLVYQELNRPDLIAMIEARYALNAPYKRAWEIVSLEGTKAFTDEFHK